MTFPGSIVPWVEMRFLKVTAEGLVPNAGGFVRWTEAETAYAVLQDTFSDADLTTPNENPIELDADGRPPDPIYLSPTGYSLQVYDSDMVELYSIPFVEDVGATFLAQTSVIQTDGPTVTSSPYLVTADDNLIQINFGSSGTVQLPAAADRPGMPLIVKNLSGFTQSVTPASGETIDGNTSAYVLPVQANPNYPTITLMSDGVSAWFIASSHAL